MKEGSLHFSCSKGGFLLTSKFTESSWLPISCILFFGVLFSVEKERNFYFQDRSPLNICARQDKIKKDIVNLWYFEIARRIP